MSYALIFAFILLILFAFSQKIYTKSTKKVLNHNTLIEKNITKNEETFGPFSKEERNVLFSIVKKTIQDGLDGKQKTYPKLSSYPEKWSQKVGVYITLNMGEKLRGCRGNQKPEKPFLHALVDASYDAAFNDKRFDNLSQQEFDSDDFNATISILGEMKEMKFKNEKDIISQMRPFEHGMLLTDTLPDGKRVRGLFLPSVWKKRPDSKNFWVGLKKKAKLKKDYWSDTLKVYTFDAEYVQDLSVKAKQDKTKINQAIVAFKNLFNEDGSVIYEINFKTGKISDKHNLVRDMGTGYGLAYAYWATKNASLKPVTVNFLNYAKTLLLKDDEKAFVQDAKGESKSGASALLLLSLIYYEQASGDTSFADMRKQLANGLVSLFEKDKGIHTSPKNAKTSPYYDGETWLALAVYNHFFPQEENIASIMNDLDDTMYKKYYEKYLYNFFHWGSQAAAFRYRTTKDEKMLSFLQHQADLYMKSQPISAHFSTCSYLEGISETASAVHETDPLLYKRIINRIETQMEIPRLLQKHISPNGDNSKIQKFSGLFLKKPKEQKTRNDITQHCLISLIKANKVMDDFE